MSAPDAAAESVASYWEAVLVDGPVSYLRLDEPPDANEWYDTATGEPVTASWFYGEFGLPGALPDGEGRGAKGYFDWSLSSEIVNPARAAEFWVMVDDIGVYNGWDSRLVVITGLFADRMTLGVSGLSLESTGSEIIDLPTPASLWFGAWHHVVLSTDGSELTLFVDGRLVGVVVLTTVGEYPEATGLTVDTGDHVVDEFAVYDDALTPVQVETHFDATGYIGPNPVGDLTVVSADNSIELSWAQPVAGVQSAEAVVGHEVAAFVDGDRVMARWVAAGTTSTTLTGLDPGAHDVVVTTFNAFDMVSVGVDDVPVTGEPGQYAGVVHSDGPLSWWRLGESEGTQIAANSGGDQFLWCSKEESAGAEVSGPLGGGSALLDDPDGSATAVGSGCGGFIDGGHRTIEAWLGPFAMLMVGAVSVVRLSNMVAVSSDGDFGFSGSLLVSDEPVESSHEWWTHVVVVLKDDRTALFVDGQMVATGDPSPEDEESNSVSEVALVGFVDEVATYADRLGASAIESHWIASGRADVRPAPGGVEIAVADDGPGITVGWDQPDVEPMAYVVRAFAADELVGAVTVPGTADGTTVRTHGAATRVEVTSVGPAGESYPAGATLGAGEMTTADLYGSVVAADRPRIWLRFDDGGGAPFVIDSVTGMKVHLVDFGWARGVDDPVVVYGGESAMVDPDDGASVTLHTLGAFMAGGDIDESQGLSIELWVRGDETNGLMAQMLTASGSQSYLQIDGEQIAVGWRDGVPANVMDGEWHHLVFTDGSGTQSLFVDGDKVAETTEGAGDSGGHGMFWGSYVPFLVHAVDSVGGAQVDEVAVYDSVRDAEQVALHFVAAGRGVGTVTAIADGQTVGETGASALTVTVESVSALPRDLVGQVVVRDQDVEIGRAELGPGGVAAVRLDPYRFGPQELTAEFLSSSTVFEGSVSESAMVLLARGYAEVDTTIVDGPVLAGRRWLLRVSVDTPITAPTGTVTVTRGGNLLATANLVTSDDGTVVFDMDALDPGAVTLGVHYGGETRILPASTSLELGVADEVVIDPTRGPPESLAALESAVWVVGVDAALSTNTVSPQGSIVAVIDGVADPTSLALVVDGEAAVPVLVPVSGSYEVEFEFVPDSDLFVGGRSTAVLVDVDRSSTSTLLVSDRAVVDAGELVTFTAEVSQISGEHLVTGSVVFAVAGMTWTVELVNGSASWSTVLPSGSHPVTAVYQGDDVFALSVGSMTQFVDEAVSVALTASATHVVVGDTVTLTATVRDLEDRPVTTGLVEFRDGDTVVGTASPDGDGRAAVSIVVGSTTGLSVGATFTGQGYQMTTSAQTVVISATRRPSAVTAEVDLSSVVYGQQPVLVVASTVVDGVPLPGPMLIEVNGVEVASWSLSSGSITRAVPFPDGSALAVGTHTITVSHPSDDSWAAGTVQVPFTVGRADIAMTVSLSSTTVGPAAETLLEFSTNAVAPGAGVPTGVVSVLVDGEPYLVDGSPLVAAAPAGSVVIPAAGLLLGDHTVVVSYGGDGSFNAGTSSPVILAVRETADVSATVLTSSPGVLGAVVDVAVLVTGSSGTPTGSVVLYDGDRAVAIGELSAGITTLSSPYIRAGSRTLMVHYRGDDSYAPTDSSPSPHEVTSGSIDTIAVVASSDPLVEGRSNKVRAVLHASGDPYVRPRGVVQFKGPNSEILGVAVVAADGTATITLSDIEVGEFHVEAVHVEGSDPNYPAGATSGLVSFDVEPPLELASRVDVTSGSAPLLVEGTIDSVSTNAVVTWSFGDGSPDVVVDPVESDTVTHTYTTPGLYTVIVVAHSTSQQVYEAHTIHVAADEPALADPGGDRRGTTGRSMAFDGSNSRPHFGIDSWHWDFGDGTTSTAMDPRHTFTTAGSYTVTLTVWSQGESATATADVEIVDPTPLGDIQVTVRSGGTLISGAQVVINDQIAGRLEAVTDSTGVAHIEGLADGVYTVYGIAGGYLPATVELVVEDQSGEATLLLDAGPVGAATLTANEMTIDEIIAAGIDPSAPENQHIVEFEIHLPYVVAQPVYFSPISGSFVGCGSIGSCKFNAGPWTVTPTPIVDAQDQLTGIGWIIIPGQVGFTKQFFDVTLVVTNLTDETFSFTDGAAILTLPEGLSLAPLPEPQELVQPLSVPGGGTGAVSWIVRGDKAGSYDLSATYVAALSPLGVPVRLEAVTGEPIVVSGPEALEMVVTVDDSTKDLEPMRLTVTMTNTGLGTLDNPVIAFNEPRVGAVLQPRQQTRWTQASLAADESMTVDLRLVAFRDGELDLEHAFVRIVSGEELGGVTFVGQTRLEAEELREVENTEIGEIAIEWDVDDYGYDVFVLDPITRSFPSEPVVSNVTDGWASFLSPPGEERLIAISRIDGSERIMVHNAVGSAGGTLEVRPRSSKLECSADTGELSLTFDDLEWALNSWRLLDTNGAIVASDAIDPPLREGTISIPLDDTFEVGWVSVTNIHDTYDGDPVWSEGILVAGCVAAPEGYEVRGDLDSVGRHGDPVNTLTGGMWLSETDLDTPHGVKGLDWTRNYDSGGTAGEPLWAFPYSERLVAMADGTVRYRSATTREIDFHPDGSGGYAMAVEEYGRLETTPVGWRIVHPDQTVIAFDAAGRVSARSFDYGQVVTAQRDLLGRLTKLTSNVKVDGSINLTFDYAGDRLTAVHASDGRSSTYGYDTTGNLTSVTLPGGITWTYGYDPVGHMTQIIDPAGVVVTDNTIDAHGRVATQTNAHGLTVGYDYGVSDIPLVPGAVHATVATDLDDETTMIHHYDDTGRLVGETDPLGNTTTTSYGPLNVVTSIVSPTGEVTDSTYFPVGSPLAGLVETRTTGLVTTTYSYDSLQRVVSESVSSTSDPQAGSLTTTYEYDGTGTQPVAINEPGGATTVFEIDHRGRITEMTDADGVTTTVAYDDVNRPVEVTDALGNSTTFAYDTRGRLTARTTPEGRRTDWSYDGADRPTRIDHPDGTYSTFGYDAFGRHASITDEADQTSVIAYDPTTGAILSVTDPLGRGTSFAHDRYGDVVSTTYPDGSVSGVEFDAARRVTAVIDQEGRTTTYVFDAEDRPVTVTDPVGLVTSLSYMPGDLIDTITDPDGTNTSYTYDVFGRETSVTTVDGTSSAVYGTSGRVDSTTDVRGVTSVFDYTNAGRLARVLVDGDRSTTFEYDAAGRQRKVTHPGGRSESVIRDGDGLVIAEATPAGLVTEIAYDEAGRPTVVTDPAGVVTTTTYDARGLVESVTRSGEGTITYGYDAAGQLVSATDANNNTTTYQPDLSGRIVRVTDATGAHWDTTYDRSGLVTGSTDPLGRQKLTTYDDSGRVATVADPSGRLIAYDYDSAGRLSAWSATNTGSTEVLAASFGYDPATSRLVSETVGGRTWTNTYDNHGALVERTNPQGRQLGWSYDDLGRVTSVTGVDGLPRDYTYDDADRVIGVATRYKVVDTFTGADGESLDPAKWKTTTSKGATASIESNAAALSVSSTAGSRAQFAYQGSERELTDTTFTVDFTDAGELSRLRAHNRYVDGSNYDLVEFKAGATKASIKRAGLLWSSTIGTVAIPESDVFKVRIATSPNWVHVKTWAVGDAEPLAWGVSIYNVYPFLWGTPKWEVTGGPDGAGTIRIDDLSISHAGDGVVAEFGYDDDGRLTSETLPGGVIRTWDYHDGYLSSFSQSGSGLDRATTLGYDSSGRVVSEATDGLVTNYGYDPAGQLVSVDAPGTANDVLYSYDVVGRRSTLTQGSTTTNYDYDTAGQLVSTISSDGNEVAYGFDGAGRRVTETSGGGVRVFGYDPVGRLISTTTGVSSVGRVLDPSGLPEMVTGSGGVTYLDWVPGGELVSLTDPDGAITTLSRPGFDSAWSSMVTGTSVRAVGSDVHGSMLLSSRGPGTAGGYDSYGQPVGATGDAVVGVGYRGEVTIDGLTFLRARDYDPVTGSFTTVDPLPGIPGAPAASNVYGYVNNSPLNATDPTGLVHVPDPLSVIAATLVGDAADTWSMVSVFGSAIGSTGVFQDFKAGASKKWDWVVDRKDIIVAGAVEFLVSIGCVAVTAGAGTTACLALGSAAGGAVYGGFNNCGDGNSISQCVAGITGEAAVWAASSVAILKAARFLRHPIKSVRNTLRTTTNTLRTAGRSVRTGYRTASNVTRNRVETTVNRIRTAATNRAHLRGQTGAINPGRTPTPSAAARAGGVTDDAVRSAMRGAPLQTTQSGGVSLPKVQRYVDRLGAGEVPPPIKVDGTRIVDGNHRYIASRIAGVDIEVQPWAGSRRPVVDWDDLPIDPMDWGD